MSTTQTSPTKSAAMLAAEAKVAKLAKQLDQAKALQARINARQNAAAREQARKDDTHRKAVLGAFLAHVMQAGGFGPAVLCINGHSFDAWLTRPHDRAFFGLAPLPDQQQQQP